MKIRSRLSSNPANREK